MSNKGTKKTHSTKKEDEKKISFIDWIKNNLVLVISAVVIVVLGITVAVLVGNANKDDLPQYVYVEMSVKDYGKIILKLDSKAAPETVKNFVSLVNKDFYDGLTFHRIIKDFMIQGGDPKGNGTGGNTDENGNEINIKGEFAENGYENPISHVRGVISMARSNEPNSASSQFFICNDDASDTLDGSYAAFGWVIDGMDVVDAITEKVFPKTDYADYYGDYEVDPEYGIPKHYVWNYLGNGTVSNNDDKPVIEYITVLENYEE